MTEADRAWSSAVRRGEVVTVPESGGGTATLDVQLEGLVPPTKTSSPAARVLEDRAQVRLHVGAAAVPAVVFLHGSRAVPAGARCLGQLRCESPVLVLGGDRFVLRDSGGQATLAVGVVLDPDGDRKYWQLKSQIRLLTERAQTLPPDGSAEGFPPAPPGPEACPVWVASALARHGVLRRAEVLRRCRFHADTVRHALDQLAREGRVILTDELAADAACWQDTLTRAMNAVDLVHRAHPDWRGLPIEALRRQFAAERAVPGMSEAVVGALCQQGFAQTGEALHRTTHRPTLPPRLQATADWLRQVLAEQPFAPPSRKELTPDPASVQALEFLITNGEVVALGPSQVLSAAAYQQAVDKVRAFLRRHGPATVSELRQLVGGPRRILVPLCEHLDHEGITQREGDLRRLGPHA
jgi:selenocysteine-specific elongation factor